MFPFPLKKIAHQTLAGFMAVWLSGFVFLFCCVAMYGGPMDAESGSTDSMSEHCKKAVAAKSAKASDGVFQLSGADSFECCGFLPGVFDKNRKLDRIERPAIVSSQRIAIPFEPAPVAFRLSNIVNRRPYIPDRQYTFIKNRVFRI